jgi:hypothetical protein
MARATDAFASSAARTATGQGSGVLIDTKAENLAVMVNVTAVSGTSPSCTFSVEWSNDGGATWAVGDAADAFTAITATGNKVKSFAVKGLMARLVWTISGTTPSFTFSSSGVTTGSRAFA